MRQYYNLLEANLPCVEGVTMPFKLYLSGIGLFITAFLQATVVEEGGITG